MTFILIKSEASDRFSGTETFFLLSVFAEHISLLKVK